MDTKRKEMLRKFIMRTTHGKSPVAIKPHELKKVLHKSNAESQPRKPLVGLRLGSDRAEAGVSQKGRSPYIFSNENWESGV